MKSENNLLEYRSEIMGLAVLGILAVHSISVIHYPKELEKLFSMGGMGVSIFAFLSGMGLYYSMESRPGISRRDFYKRRFIRVFLPYLLIAGSWYFIRDILVEGSILSFCYELSTLSFWLEHHGAWYVAMLIPVYLVFPIYYDYVEKSCIKNSIVKPFFCA